MKQDKSADLRKLDRDDPQVYARPRWRHATRVFGALTVIVFNITMIGSNIDRYHKGKTLTFERELVAYILLLLCDLMILLPILVEVDIAKVTDDKLILKTTFFKTAIPWTAITEFKLPRYLIYGIVRTNRCFYLINRKLIPRFDRLAREISSRVNTD
jgi:hypothetical protein